MGLKTLADVIWPKAGGDVRAIRPKKPAPCGCGPFALMSQVSWRTLWLGLGIHDPVDDTKQDAKSHLKPGACVGWMRFLASVSAEQRTDIASTGAQFLLRRLRDAEIDLVAGTHLHGVLGAERVILLRKPP